MRKQRKSFFLILFDFLTAAGVWFIFYIYRVINIEETELVFKGSFWVTLVCLPFLWIFLYTIQGTYIDIKKRYRLKTIKQTLFATVIGSIGVFFFILLNDFVVNYTQFYKLFLLFLGLHFLITLIPRIISTTVYVKKIHKGQLGFKTVIIGGSQKALDLINDIRKLKQNPGYDFVGYVNINGSDFSLKSEMPYLGHIADITSIVNDHDFEEVILALESSEHEKLKGIISSLSAADVKINVIPDAYDILSGQVKMNSIFGALLIDITPSSMPDWQFASKRIIDVLFSFLAILILIPVYLTLAILVKTTSKGPVFFTQERIGKNRKPFKIIKYRTMQIDAEKEGPQLSSTNDSRITSVGKFMRKSRLDEFPQFWNVLIGDMSLVGPRPERQFYIDKISKMDPQYLFLHKVRPGITSWGQVKFGYAENVDQMVQRMKYDLLYIRNMSLALDIKIMFYTIAIVFKGSGK
ncbi:MAG: exopolysaccharide biosynthesis polyprenyl glycosylphosphotransferase [Arenicella sp.]